MRVAIGELGAIEDARLALPLLPDGNRNIDGRAPDTAASAGIRPPNQDRTKRHHRHHVVEH